MLNCNLKIVNALYENNRYKINYIPYSVSTIKILIHNLEDFDIDVFIRPSRFQNTDDFCGGYDDDYKGLKIFWGGGQENGLQTVVKRNDKKYVFLFVFHKGDYETLLNYNLTLLVYKGSSLTDLPEEIGIELYSIQTVQLIDNITHQKIIHNSKNTEITFDGDLLGSYYPRWYPELYGSLVNTVDYYRSEPHISNISLKVLRKSYGFDNDRLIINFKDNTICILEGDIDGANYHIDVFRFYTALIIRIWFLWLSKSQFRDRSNLEPLQLAKEKKGIFDILNNPELPDFERFDIVISSDGNVLAVCTDFHWQEYWYKKIKSDINMVGVIAKSFPPINNSLLLLWNRNAVNNKYELIINELKKITSQIENSDMNSELIYVKGEEIEQCIQNTVCNPVEKGKNFFKSHVPYVRNGYILPNMISHVVDQFIDE